MKAAWALDIGRTDRFVVRAEVHDLVAQPTRPAEYVPALMTEPPEVSFVPACMMNTVAFGGRCTGDGLANALADNLTTGIGARISAGIAAYLAALRRSAKRSNAARACEDRQ